MRRRHFENLGIKIGFARQKYFQGGPEFSWFGHDLVSGYMVGRRDILEDSFIPNKP